MSEIRVIHKPSRNELDSMGVFEWPVWEKEISEFPWTYESQEICYVLEGEVVVTLDGGVGPLPSRRVIWLSFLQACLAAGRCAVLYASTTVLTDPSGPGAGLMGCG